MSALADEYHYGMDMNFIHWTYSAILLMVSHVVPRGCAGGGVGGTQHSNTLNMELAFK